MGVITASGRRRVPAVALVLAAALVALALNPLGYRGGGADDWHYLEAARCAAAHGLCPPADHWWARLPLVGPMGLALAALGESRAVLAIVPLAYAAAALACFTLLVARLWGRAEAIVAGALLATTPAAALAYLQPNVDLPELAFLLGAALAFQSAAAGGRRSWAAAAGALLGLAILTRPTALAALPILALFIAAHPPLRRLAAPALLGLAAPLLLEAAFYGLWLGEPLLSWSLSLGHTDIATDQLPPDFHSARGPLLNPDYIAAWRPAMGIRVHWTVDPALNLLANPAMGTLLVAALLLALLSRPRRSEERGRAILWLLAAGILYFGALAYGLGVDPKPRMFLPVAAAAAAVAGIAAVVLAPRSLWLAALPVAAVIGASLVRIAAEPDLSGLEAPARAWMAADRGGIAVELRTGRLLALVPGVAALPVAPAPARPRLMVVAFGRCADEPDFRAGWRVERSYYLGRAGEPPPGVEAAALCLFARAPSG